MARPCVNVPNEIWSNIIRMLDGSWLQQASLVSRRFRRLVQPELFRKIDLTPLTAAEVELLCDDLFHSGDGNRNTGGFLTGHCVYKLTNSFRETSLDVKHKQTAACNILQGLGRISVLELEVTLSSRKDADFEQLFLPAMETFFRYVREKVSVIRLSIYAQPAGFGWMTSKLSAFLSLLPCNAVVSLGLHNVDLVSLPYTFTQALSSSSLKNLSVNFCDELLKHLPTIANLESFSLSSISRNDNPGALEAAFRICKNSAATLSSLTFAMRLTGGAALPQVPSLALRLPHLSRLRLVFSHNEVMMGSDSPFIKIFSHISVPMLRTLEVVMDNFFGSVEILLGMLKSLLNLRNLKLFWTFKRPFFETATSVQQCCFQMLEEECLQRDITLQNQIFILCATSDELTHDFERLEILASTIVRLTLDCRGSSMTHINSQNPILFPRLLHLGLVTDIEISTEGWNLATTDILRPLLSKLICPNLRTLEVYPYSGENMVAGIYDELEQILQEGMYPILERIVGRLRAGGLTAGDVQALQQRLISACQSRGVDYSKLCSLLPRGARQTRRRLGA